MSNTNNNLLIGDLLQYSGLVSQEQVQKALHFQKKFPRMKLGEILVIQNKVKSKTIDFFVDKWTDIKQRGYQFPIGYYLQQAALLDNQQIREILTEQKGNQLKFGDIAVAKEWLTTKTVDFFLDDLSINPSQLLSLEQLEKYDQDQLNLDQKYANSSLILTRILAWTGGNSILSRDICQFFVDSDLNIPPGKEYKTVDQLIESELIKNWPTSKSGRSIRSIKEDLDNNQQHSSLKLWQEYQEILLSDNKLYQRTKEQDELLKIGLIVRVDNKLRVTNLIFSQIFNQDLIAKQTNKNIEINKKIAKEEEHLNNVEQTNKNNTELRESQNMPKINNDEKSKINNLLTKKKTLMTLAGLVLLVPLVLIANSFFSSSKKTNQLTSLQKNTPKTLQKFCDGIDVSDSSSRLNMIFKLEQKKKSFLKNNPENSSDFPDICEGALNEMRMLAVPDLGKENKTIEALRHLCNVPLDSEFITESEVWLDRWYHSSTWSKETKFYLKKAPNCPAGKPLLGEAEHDDH